VVILNKGINMPKQKKVQPSPLPVPEVITPPKLIKLDLGCGKNKASPEHLGVDSIKFDGVDVVCDLLEELDPTEFVKKNQFRKFKAWPWDDNSVDEVHCSHFIEHTDARERIHFLNELYRILKPGAKATIIGPHWSSRRATGDLSHAWPPLSEFAFYYYDRHWRLGDSPNFPTANAPHLDIKYNPAGLDCHFAVTWGYSLPPEIKARNDEYQQFAINHWKDVCEDIYATFVKVVD
jgi:SAM-dependent methyltransferase